MLLLAQNGSTGIVRLLLDEGADMEITDSVRDFLLNLCQSRSVVSIAIVAVSEVLFRVNY